MYTNIDMDYGDDPMLSSGYAHVHSYAEAAQKPGKGSMIETIRLRHAWSKQPLDVLRDQSITAEMLCASGAKWSTLQGKHGTDALIRFGYSWPLMVQAGFTSRNYGRLTPAQLSHLGVNAVRAMECRPRISDIRVLQLSASELRDMGWTRELLGSTGLTMQSMVGFGFSLAEWADTLGVRDYPVLGFTTYSDCAAAGWSDRDIRLALAPAAAPVAPVAPAAPAAPVVVRSRRRGGGLTFL